MQEGAIARLLPEVYQDAALPGTPLLALLAAMAALHEPVEARLADLDTVFDPRRAPEAFVAMLADWLGLAPLLQTGAAERGQRPADIDPASLRELVAHAAELSRARGTLPSLQGFIELATGLRGIDLAPAVDAAGAPRPFAATLTLPASARPLRAIIDRVVEHEKPAFTTIDIIERPQPTQETT